MCTSPGNGSFCLSPSLRWRSAFLFHLRGRAKYCSVRYSSGRAFVLDALSTGRSATLTLTFVSLFCTLRYFYWRWTTTLRHIHDNGWQVGGWGLFFAFVLLGAETYAVIVL